MDSRGNDVIVFRGQHMLGGPEHPWIQEGVEEEKINK